MPKRDPAYMAGQRGQIAAAALECLLEKGLGATSLRDICLAANVSVGAFYTHFASKDEAVVAACSIDWEPVVASPPARTWQEFREDFRKLPADLVNPAKLRRFRLSLQIVAEFAVDGLSTEFDGIFAVQQEAFEQSLRSLADNSEITLPLGLRETARMFARLLAGTAYMATADRSGDREADVADMLRAMALIAGRPADKS